MKRFAIMQEPGPAARARRRRYDPVFSPPSRRVAIVEAATRRDALAAFLAERYPEGHRQYRGHRFEWRGARLNAAWRPDDGADNNGREWRAVVTLANGAYVHETAYQAWEHDGRWERS